MPKWPVGLLFFLLLLSMQPGEAHAQAPAVPGYQEALEEAGQPEEPPVVTVVELQGNLLSVDLVNAEFGEVMQKIAEKAGLNIEIGGDVPHRRLSTKFRDVELERGIVRLLSLVKEKNYSLKYDLAGALNRVEIYGGIVPSPPQQARPPMPGIPQSPRPFSGPVPQRPDSMPATPSRKVTSPSPASKSGLTRFPPAPAAQAPVPSPLSRPAPALPENPSGPPVSSFQPSAPKPPETRTDAPAAPAVPPAIQRQPVIQKNPPLPRRILPPLGQRRQEIQPAPVKEEKPQEQPAEQENTEWEVGETPYIPPPAVSQPQ